MKKQSKFKKILKVTAITCSVAFLSVFTWANWSPLSPGQKAAPVQFAQFDISSITDSTKAAQLREDVSELPGVTAAAFNMESQILSVGYQIDDTDCGTLQQTIKSALQIALPTKNLESTGPKCPMTATLNAMATVKKTLNIRN
ncbi:MAG: cation transporter [Crocinitomicaceae bacterium]|nr:MAG: cation transporter [Crocinitomicaceae bacterium]